MKIRFTVIFIILKFIAITEIIAKNDTEEITKLTLMISEIKDVFIFLIEKGNYECSKFKRCS